MYKVLKIRTVLCHNLPFKRSPPSKVPRFDDFNIRPTLRDAGHCIRNWSARLGS
ncbi:hypothetical protein BJ165DRAFT_1517482 [Panaeolus papilionaceus]|nr:hypothetical protein BJ165DRAFT_1517482 [Panaeolus papilionaceus]